MWCVLQVRSVQSDHDDLVAQNKSLAEYNLSLRPRLDSLKTQVATGYESINKLKTQLGMDKARLGLYQYGGGDYFSSVGFRLNSRDEECSEFLAGMR